MIMSSNTKYQFPMGKVKEIIRGFKAVTIVQYQFPMGKVKTEDNDADIKVLYMYQFPMGKVKMIGTKKQEVKALVSIPYGKGKVADNTNDRRNLAKSINSLWER